MNAYRAPAGTAPEEPTPEPERVPDITDSALVGSGSKRWIIRFVRRFNNGDFLFEVTTYKITRKWWGGRGPLQKVERQLVRGMGRLLWRTEDGYYVDERLVDHLHAAENRQRWLEEEEK